jgi:hypothetical protein
MKQNQQGLKTSLLKCAQTVILSILVRKEQLKQKVELRDLEGNIKQIKSSSIVFEIVGTTMNANFSIEDNM